MVKTILMKVTSRNRPEVLLETIKQYIELANDLNNMIWYFTFDEDDKSMSIESKFSEDLRLLSAQYKLTFKAFHGISLNKIDAINRDVKHIEDQWNILLNISDDQRPIKKGYDDLIRNAMPDDLDASLWFWDGHQNRINTQEILGRTYYERFHYIYYPEYRSFFCDNEATEVAQSLNKIVRSPLCIIKHFHPQWMQNQGPIKTDALYTANDKHWKHDELLYQTRKKNNFN